MQQLINTAYKKECHEIQDEKSIYEALRIYVMKFLGKRFMHSCEYIVSALGDFLL